MLAISTEAARRPVLDREVVETLSSAWEEAHQLEAAAHLALSDPAAALDKLSAIVETGAFPFLRVAAIALVAKGISGPPRESDIRRQFYRGLGGYLPGAIPSKVRTIGANVPDGFVIWRSRECPVEIKRSSFDAKALRQLQRYMTVYDAEVGIAVAPALTCELPPSIHFVEIK